jgi:MFS family permease
VCFFTGVLAAAIFAGMFVGGIFFGALSDQIGRRKSLLYSLLVNALFALLSSVSPNIYALIAFRTCAGIGASCLEPVLCCESTHDSHTFPSYSW